MKHALFFDSPIGRLGVAERDGSITDVYLREDKVKEPLHHEETPVLLKAKAQILEYLIRRRTTFTLPLMPVGTPFQRRVWDALLTIPYGETRSYADIAHQVNSPKGFRAVGSANGKNPIAIIIPCHRVIGSGGTLTGFGGGLEMKRALLTVEGIAFDEQQRLF